MDDSRTCKVTCDDLFCNSGPVVPVPQCFVCDYTWDDFGLVGTGDFRCKNTATLTASMRVNCPAGESYCVTGWFQTIFFESWQQISLEYL